MLGKEKSIREEIEKTGDIGGDLHLELAECLLEQEKYDEACENLLFCLRADTMVRDGAYPLLVDLLAKQKCVDLIPYMTIEWLSSLCYIEPDEKKAMYRGIAFGTENLSKIGLSLECYIREFGGDINVGAMYDRLEDLTYVQEGDSVDVFYYEIMCDALCEAIKNGLSPTGLSYFVTESVYFHTDSERAAFECLKYIYESNNRELLQERDVFSTVTKNNGVVKNAIVRLLDYYISQNNYEFVAWIYNDLTCYDNALCIFDYGEVCEKIHTRVLDFVLAPENVKTVATFFKTADEAAYHCADYEQIKALSDFVIQNYFDENGNVRDEWKEVPDLVESSFTTFVDDVFFVAAGEKELEATYGSYDKRILRTAFEACRGLFERLFLNKEEFNKAFEVQDGKFYFISFEGYDITVEDKESFLYALKQTLNNLKDRYF